MITIYIPYLTSEYSLRLTLHQLEPANKVELEPAIKIGISDDFTAYPQPPRHR